MPKFNVSVTSDDPQETREALDRAGVPTIGPAYAYYVGNPAGGNYGPRMTAVFDADNEDAALDRVREAVGTDCQVEVAD